ncbi:GT2 family glycosyltransferase [Sagittula marina]|uniref:GT2 family glycosyltransferase n=1 Tax=Sagittula marina TaxID=943940 RepID=A0A7W6DZT5_9RHOB|nr:GT2 family glycosyltransferase [Sagittula marina]
MLHRIRRLFGIYAAYHLPEDSAHPRRDRLLLIPPFVRAGARAFPHAIRWARMRDPAARARVKQLLDLSGPAPLALDARLFEPPSAGPDPQAVTIVMPVYGGLPLLRQALDHVVRHTDIPWRIILIDDASPDDVTLPFLRDWAAQHPAILLENAQNLGFVGSVNRGLAEAMAHPDPVVLLNSDALVPDGWARRLLRPLLEDARVASVTPMSNDAELGSIPEPGRASPITAEEAAQIDCFARETNGVAWVPAVAGVGFCMALSREALEAIPRFDEAFSPGYGEEVDWCQKTRASGCTHVYVPNLYVAHVGGQSFGSAQKQALIQRNSAILTRRYPRFDAEVHGFLRRDPLVTARLALGLARAEVTRDAPLPITLAHSMGGGAETDLQRRLHADLERVGHALVIRVGGMFRFTLELWTRRPDGGHGMTAAGTAEWDHVTRLLAPVTQRALVYSCGVGDPDPITLPDLLLSLRQPSDRLTVLMHDYFPLSPNPTLLEDGEHWRGLPDPASTSPRHETRRPDGAPVPLSVWRATWGRLLYAADRVEHFSRASQNLTEAAYPGTPSDLRPHALPVAVPPLPRPAPEAPCVLGILGSLAPHKGAALAEALSRETGRNRDCSLVLLGGIDPAHRLHAPARHHGRYDVGDLPRLAARYGVTCWLIPSLWPETFSFTTHEALATGLPVMVFDLGGQGEAARAAPNGHPVPLDLAGDPGGLLARAISLSQDQT